MKYRIIGTTIPAVEIKFDAPGETMYTQSGGMSWMSEGISMSTNTRGGFMKGLGRMFAGESMFMATYRADAPGARSHLRQLYLGRFFRSTRQKTAA